MVEDSLNRGTFNFAPANFAGGIPHAIVDILPWLILGNDPISMFTNAPDRFSSTASATVERFSDATDSFGGQLNSALTRILIPSRVNSVYGF